MACPARSFIHICFKNMKKHKTIFFCCVVWYEKSNEKSRKKNTMEEGVFELNSPMAMASLFTQFSSLLLPLKTHFTASLALLYGIFWECQITQKWNYRNCNRGKKFKWIQNCEAKSDIWCWFTICATKLRCNLSAWDFFLHNLHTKLLREQRT